MNKISIFQKIQKHESLQLLLVMFLMALFVRSLAITVPINTDEVLWMRRGSFFLQNLLEFDLAETYQKHHPGTTNMWLLSVAAFGNCILHKFFPSFLGLNAEPHFNACLNSSFSGLPISFYILPKFLQAIVTSTCMVGIYLLSKQIFSRNIALIAFSILLFEPFFLGYQRYITTDSFQANFTVLAILAFLLHMQQDRNRFWLLLSSIFLGLAAGSKITALFILPGVFITVALIETGIWKSRFSPKGWMSQILSILLWGIVSAAVFCLLLPALWVEPISTLQKFYEGLLGETERGYFFFLGEVTHSPNALFYPLVFLYRLSPVLQIGWLVSIGVLLFPKSRNRYFYSPDLWILHIISIVTLVVFSLPDTKIDRYINPMIPILALLAAVGWWHIGVWVKIWFSNLQFWQANIQKSGGKIAIVVAIAQFLFIQPHIPYYLTYYNPIWGGSQVAKQIFMVGQGEGFSLAAKWLHQNYNIEQLKVASWYSKAFRAYYRGEILPVYKWNWNPYLPWTYANRVLVYYNQFQRKLPDPEFIEYFSMQQPLHTVTLNGIDYVRIYPGPAPLSEEIDKIKIPQPVDFDNWVRLLGYELDSQQVAAGEILLATFYWEFFNRMPADARIHIQLTGKNQPEQQYLQQLPLNGYLPEMEVISGTRLRDVHPVQLNTDLSAGTYELQVGWQVDQPVTAAKIVWHPIGEIEVR